jgi:hypothetical protein
MSPVTADLSRQFAFILSAEEHRMLGTLAEHAGQSQAEWVRTKIRDAFAAGKFESDEQTVGRLWEAFVIEHDRFLDRFKAMVARGLQVPTYEALHERARQLQVVACLAHRDPGHAVMNPYLGAVGRTRKPLTDRTVEDIIGEFNKVYRLVDGWLDELRAQS